LWLITIIPFHKTIWLQKRKFFESISGGEISPKQVLGCYARSTVITGQEKFPGMILISELGGFDLGRDSTDHYKLAPSMMSLMCRYGADKENFKEVDKFLVRAVIFDF